MNEALAITVRRERGCVIVAVTGEIDISTVAGLRERLFELPEGGEPPRRLPRALPARSGYRSTGFPLGGLWYEYASPAPARGGSGKRGAGVEERTASVACSRHRARVGGGRDVRRR